MKSRIYLVTWLLLLTTTNPVHAQSLSLRQFKDAVQSNDPGYKSAQLAAKGSQQLSSEADSLTGVQFEARAVQKDDKRATIVPAFQGERTKYKSYLLGLKQQTPWGLQWSLSQNYANTQIDFPASTTPARTTEFNDSYPKLELSLSLWRNFLGAETSAQIDQTEQLSLARQKQAEIQYIQKDMDIETAYYSVLALQQALEAQKDSVSRSEKVLEWTKGRISRNLADNSDIYQAQAAVTSRKIDLLTSQTNLNKAIEKFNSLRGIQSNQLKEKLVDSEISIEKLKLSKKENKVRKDLRLSQFNTASNQASYLASKEKHKPQLDLSFSALKQSRDVVSDNTQYRNKDDVQVALTFTVPINQIKESRFRDGYNNLALSQKLSEQSRLQDELLTWNSNVDQAQQLHDQVFAARELEGLQKNKANAEREKFNRGRSTLFQVLSYEQDYLAARSQRINLELQVRQFISQLNLFE
ncbi:MAG: TolC family protein [Pseudobdellovibrionaceae bacterium]